FSLSIGSPYGNSFSYYNGPWYGNYVGYQRPNIYTNLSIYDPYWSNYSPYGTYYSPRSNYIDYYLPPTYYPAEVAYGPQAMKQFLGVDRNFALGPLQEQPRVAAKPDLSIVPEVKEINWEGRRKADQYIAQGDGYFQKQKFNDALLRYKLAVAASPDYATAYLRHGFSLIACRRYEEATVALKKAFVLEPQIVKSGFHLDQLYADNRMVREGHEEALAQAALDAPSDGGLMFDVGMWLIFSGQAERSVKFFEKARELGVDVGKDL
ncbi:MAG TPA: hypothetical protein VL096_05140, partial [Pirellulaceae bacterium]|nr:hypothetical protein [Pirellulaceae bacterium]